MFVYDCALSYLSGYLSAVGKPDTCREELVPDASMGCGVDQGFSAARMRVLGILVAAENCRLGTSHMTPEGWVRLQDSVCDQRSRVLVVERSSFPRYLIAAEEKTKSILGNKFIATLVPSFGAG